MKREYGFSDGRRGPLFPPAAGKTRITIRLDDDVLAWFRDMAEAAGGGSYQSMINAALRQFIQREGITVELRRVLREELVRTSSEGDG